MIRFRSIARSHDEVLNRNLPPVIILGGDQGALSIARSLGAAGIQVYAINYPNADVRYSRFCRWINLPEGTQRLSDIWSAYLLGRESDHLLGAVLLAASDEGIEIIAKHRHFLSEKFLLDESDPAAQLCMLDKLCTYRAAQQAGVPTPRFWVADTREDIQTLESELLYPLVLKPFVSHQFRGRFTGSYAVANNIDELLNVFDTGDYSGIRTFLVEMIPGPDDRLCSYYTYLDEKGNNLVNFTKRVIRRYPVNMGGSTYHITDHVPDVQELGLALFRQVGLRGVANVEFKLDGRDDKLKLIECNARFTAADCLLVESGLNLPLFVYNRIVGRPQQLASNYRMGLRLWKPVADFAACRQLRNLGLLTLRTWIRSIMHPQVFPVFRWDDPLPSIAGNIDMLKYAWSRLVHPKSAKASVGEPIARTNLFQPGGSTVDSVMSVAQDQRSRGLQ